MKKALRIDVDGTTEVLDLEAPQGSLKVLQEAVGGWVEVVDLTEQVAIWCNEEGKIIGLPKNSFATELFQLQFGAVDVINGNVVLTGGADDEGDTIGLTDEQVEQYKYLVELKS